MLKYLSYWQIIFVDNLFLPCCPGKKHLKTSSPVRNQAAFFSYSVLIKRSITISLCRFQHCHKACPVLYFSIILKTVNNKMTKYQRRVCLCAATK